MARSFDLEGVCLTWCPWVCWFGSVLGSCGYVAWPLGSVFARVSLGLLVWGVVGFTWFGCVTFRVCVCPGVFGFAGLGVFGFMWLGCLTFTVWFAPVSLGLLVWGVVWVNTARLLDL